jgi:ferredoxin-thioredoxin reductase catalytic subunit
LKNDSKKNAEIMIWAASKNSEYYSYQLIAVSKNHRKLIICDCTYIDPSIIDRIKEKCGLEVEAEFSCQ